MDFKREIDNIKLQMEWMCLCIVFGLWSHRSVYQKPHGYFKSHTNFRARKQENKIGKRYFSGNLFGKIIRTVAFNAISSSWMASVHLSQLKSLVILENALAFLKTELTSKKFIDFRA